MPLNVQKMAAKENDLEFNFAEETVNVRYRSGIITNAWEAKHKGDPEGLYKQVEELVVSWDVLNEKGKPLPTDVATLKTLPVEFLAAVVRECASDLVPNRKTSARSGGSSFGD